MKSATVTLLFLIASSTRAQSPAQSSATETSFTDALGTWQTTRSPQAGISIQTPCKPEVSYSNPQDGYGHASEEVELKCRIGWNALFRIDRTTYKNVPGNVQKVFGRYMDLIRSIDAGTQKGPRVMIAGQQRETHQDFALTQKSVHGDLGYHQAKDQCFWNFYGLAGDSIIQAIMMVPKEMCPSGDQPALTAAAARFYESILVDGV